MEQYGIKLLAKAYEYLPRQLAENCGQNPSKVISKLLAAHSAVEGSLFYFLEPNIVVRNSEF
jgi:chaperonin GroEL (HSP60 family)